MQIWVQKKKKQFLFFVPQKKKIVEKIFKKINKTLTHLNIADKKDFLVDALTHGEKKLLEIAMLLISDCDVLLLDEPLAGVDKIESDFIVKIICELSKNKLILLVEHDIEVVLNISNSVSVLNNGELIISSDPKSVKNNTLVNQIYFDKANENNKLEIKKLNSYYGSSHILKNISFSLEEIKFYL